MEKVVLTGLLIVILMASVGAASSLEATPATVLIATELAYEDAQRVIFANPDLEDIYPIESIAAYSELYVDVGRVVVGRERNITVVEDDQDKLKSPFDRAGAQQAP